MIPSRQAKVCDICRGRVHESETTRMDETIYRNALGRHGVLGELYDARTDALTKTNILSAVAPQSAVRCLESSPNVSTEVFIDGESQAESERIQKLPGVIGADMKFNLMLGFVKPEGSVANIDESKRIACSIVTGSVAFQIVTKLDVLRVNHADLKDLIVPQMLKHSEATHVVAGIEWGVSGLLMFQKLIPTDGNRTNCKITQMAGATMERAMMDAAQKIERAIIGPPIKVGPGQLAEHVKKGSVQFRLVSDIVVDPDAAGASLHDFTGSKMTDIASQISLQLKSCSNGKGRPLVFTLFSIESLAKRYMIDGVKGHVMNPLVPTVMSIQLELVLEELAKQRRALRSLRDHVLRYGSEKLTGMEVAEVVSRLAAAEKLELDFQRQMRDCVLEFRSGKRDEVSVESAVTTFRQEKLLQVKSISSFLESKIRDL